VGFLLGGGGGGRRPPPPPPPPPSAAGLPEQLQNFCSLVGWVGNVLIDLI